MKRKTKFVAIMLIFALVMSSFNGFSVSAETIPASGSSVKSSASYASRIVKIYVDGKAYVKGDIIEASSLNSEENPDVNITSVVLNDGTILESTGSGLFGEINIKYQMLSYSKNGGMVTSVYQMCIYDHDSYTSCVQFLKVKLTRKSNADDEEEIKINDNKINNQLDEVNDYVKTNYFAVLSHQTHNIDWLELNDLSLLIKGKNNAKKAKFKSLNKKLFTIKNNRKLVWKENVCGNGYLQVSIDGKIVANILAVLYPGCNGGPGIKIVKMRKMEAKVKIVKDVSNVKVIKFNPWVYVSNRDKNKTVDIVGLKKNSKEYKKLIHPLKKVFSKKFPKKQFKFKLAKNSNISIGFYANFPGISLKEDGVVNKFRVKNSSFKKMKLNKWYSSKKLKKMGINV
ncbi:MAG: hypothetical protein J6B50_13015 [Lachnospiraceae bacterium]|nr:hypothetical protein [Lachnospiraceae bacterium]